MKEIIMTKEQKAIHDLCDLICEFADVVYDIGGPSFYSTAYDIKKRANAISDNTTPSDPFDLNNMD